MLASVATALPAGPGWTYEVKWDGYRAFLVKRGARVRLLSRNLKDVTDQYSVISRAAAAVQSDDFTLDGEIVALDEAGRPSFQALQHRSSPAAALVYYAFDVLALDGEDLTRLPLEERRRALDRIRLGPPLLRSEALPGTAAQIEREVRRLGLEGVIAKRRDSVYEPGRRSGAWVKVKFARRQEFVIGGFKPLDRGFDSILVGYYEGRNLYYAGKVRAGFTPHSRAEVFDEIRALTVARCPFANLPNSTGKKSHWGEGITAEDMEALVWVKPRVVVEVAFTEWTSDANLRHASFAGLRDDKNPKSVRRES